MNGSGLSGIGCLGEGCFSRKERKDRKGMEMTEEKAKEVCDEMCLGVRSQGSVVRGQESVRRGQ